MRDNTQGYEGKSDDEPCHTALLTPSKRMVIQFTPGTFNKTFLTAERDDHES